MLRWYCILVSHRRLVLQVWLKPILLLHLKERTQKKTYPWFSVFTIKVEMASFFTNRLCQWSLISAYPFCSALLCGCFLVHAVWENVTTSGSDNDCWPIRFVDFTQKRLIQQLMARASLLQYWQNITLKSVIHAGLVCQGYIPEKCCTNWT